MSLLFIFLLFIYLFYFYFFNREEPVSSGIRRIIAVTGEEARTAHGNADKLEEECKQLEKLSDQKDKIQILRNLVIPFNTRVNQIQIPAFRKLSLRNRIAKLNKLILGNVKDLIEYQKQVIINIYIYDYFR